MPTTRPERHPLYTSPEWRALRAAQLKREPYCAMCIMIGRAVLATVADHKRPHRGDRRLFFDPHNLWSLCAHHHNSTKKTWENRGSRRFGQDGWPID